MCASEASPRRFQSLLEPSLPDLHRTSTDAGKHVWHSTPASIPRQNLCYACHRLSRRSILFSNEHCRPQSNVQLLSTTPPIQSLTNPIITQSQIISLSFAKHSINHGRKLWSGTVLVVFHSKQTSKTRTQIVRQDFSRTRQNR